MKPVKSIKERIGFRVMMLKRKLKEIYRKVFPVTAFMREQRKERKRHSEEVTRAKQMKPLFRIVDEIRKQWDEGKVKRTSGSFILTDTLYAYLYFDPTDSLETTVPSFLTKLLKKPFADKVIKPDGMFDDTDRQIRTYKFEMLPTKKFSLHLDFHWGSSEVCTLIETGKFEKKLITEMKRVPILKIVCK